MDHGIARRGARGDLRVVCARQRHRPLGGAPADRGHGRPRAGGRPPRRRRRLPAAAAGVGQPVKTRMPCYAVQAYYALVGLEG
jgi:hypothetical protein